MTPAELEAAREAVRAEGLWTETAIRDVLEMRFPDADPGEIEELAAHAAGIAVEQLPSAVIQAGQRATSLIERTAYFEELGLHALAADARAVARELVDVVELLAAEQSARRAMQQQRDELRAMLAERPVAPPAAGRRARSGG